MAILFAFSPFLAFVIIERLFDIPAGLLAGTVVSAALTLNDLLRAGRKVKIMESCTLLLFAGLTAMALWGSATTWSIAIVRLYVDGGLLLIVLLSIALRRPFTMQYARETSPSTALNSPRFLQTNYVISGVWAAAFTVMVLADVLLVYAPELPHSIAITVTILALFGAFKFTKWYPESVRKKTHHVAV